MSSWVKLLMGERSSAASDDNSITNQIQATHAPDGCKVDVKPILQIVEDILRRAAPTIDDVKNEPIVAEENTDLTEHDHDLPEIVAKAIQKVHCELSCKCSTGGAEPHATTMVLLNLLSRFSWDAKIVITLAAFAEIYGEFGLVVQLYATNPLAKSVAQLKQLKDVLEDSDLVKPHFDALNKLNTAMLDVNKCILQIKELQSQYTLAESQEISTAMAQFPMAAYLIIRSAVSILISLGHGHMASSSEARELSNLALQLNKIHEGFTKQISYIDEKISYHKLVSIFGASRSIQIDVIGCLRELIDAKDNVVLPELKGNHVLLLISDLDISDEDIKKLDQIYKSRGKNDQYKILWIPIIDDLLAWNEECENKFQQLRLTMPWYWVHPSIIKPVAIKFIKEMWYYQNKTILVTLSPEGKVLCPNAIHMMWIWGNEAFPFNTEMQETLWDKVEALKLDFLATGIDSTLLEWMKEGKIICLYGGEDMEWIREFTTAAKNVTEAAEILLEIVYVGKSYTKDRVKKIISTIEHESLSHYWSDQTSVSFWARLETMLYSKLQHGKSTDTIIKEVMAMLSLNGSDEGWAIFLQGENEMALARGDIAITSMMEYEKWIHNTAETSFVSALNDNFQAFRSRHHCNHLMLPFNSGGIPQKVMLICTDCGRPMEKYFMYRCCVD